MAKTRPLSNFLTEPDIPDNFETMSDEEIMQLIEERESASKLPLMSRFRDHIPSDVELPHW